MTRKIELVLLALFCGGCSLTNEYPLTNSEGSEAACADGVDNDVDGRADCYDPGCAEHCQEDTATRCSDGEDNDKDGNVDCRDMNCGSYCQENGETICADGLDNDEDGVADCRDPECAEFCREDTEQACTDGEDNDEDGNTDCYDNACAAFCAEGTAETCRDGEDNDKDGDVDCYDNACSQFCLETTLARCGDGEDNDKDGDADCYDIGCAEFCREDSRLTCADEEDNDKDGDVDCLDNDCAEFCLEEDLLACRDGKDNDEDGRTDCEDSACAVHCLEDDEHTCTDERDNDEDGAVDCYDTACALFCLEDDESTCADGEDNDKDGEADCYDESCVPFCLEDSEETCSDDLDNDVDGATDCEDANCIQFCPEASVAACADGGDNDLDGATDCDDTGCDGFCPEQETGTCFDGRDNDGDGFTDAADPRCWPFASPEVLRCESPEETDYLEKFDSPLHVASRWYPFGTYPGGSASLDAVFGHASGVATFRWNTTGAATLDGNLGGATSGKSFAGAWEALRLSFRAGLPRAVNRIEVALLPEALAPLGAFPTAGIEASVVAVRLDSSTLPNEVTLYADGAQVTTTLPELPYCGSAPCDSAFRTVELAATASDVVVAVRDFADQEVTLNLALPQVREIPPSRVVLWGGSATNSFTGGAALDDLRIGFGSEEPCGMPVPQIPAGSCGDGSLNTSFGHTVSSSEGALTGEAPVHCAIVLAGAAGASTAERATSWMSEDGRDWAPAHDAVFSAPAGASVVGASVAWDPGLMAWSAVAVVGGTVDATLQHSSSADCSTWSPPIDTRTLPADAEAPSLVFDEDGMTVFVTRPPSGNVQRTLWRGAIALSTTPLELLAELPPEVKAPVSVQAVGNADLALSFARNVSGAAPGMGLLVGGRDGRSWERVEPSPFLGAGRAGEFDANGILASSLRWTPMGGFALYSGVRAGRLATGTALLVPAGQSFPTFGAPPRCGDAACDVGESCATCPGDCPCSGVTLLSDPFEAQSGWVWDGFETSDLRPYLQSAPPTLHWTGEDRDLGYAALPLAEALVGDFELAFDVVLNPSEIPGSTMIGLAATQVSAAPWDREGIFIELVAPDVVECPSQGEMRGTLRVQTGASTHRTSEPTISQLFTDCAWDGGGVPAGLDARQRAILRKERGSVSVTIIGPNCEGGVETIQGLDALPPLSALMVSGTGWDTAAISNLQLRLLEDPGSCPADTTLCDDSIAQATCADLDSVAEHCGACFRSCGQGVCEAGTCSCLPGRMECPDETGLATACVDVVTSETDCGGCGLVCASGTTCKEGVCATGESCLSPTPIPLGVTTWRFDAAGHEWDVDLTCANTSGDSVYAWTAEQTGVATVTVRGADGVGVDTVLSVADDPTCQVFLGCNDEGAGLNGGSQVAFPVTAGVTYYLVVALYGTVPSAPPRTVDLQIEVL